MIRVTREQLMASERGLSVLAAAKLPISVSYKVNKIIGQIAKEMQETEKIRQEILQKYAKRDDSGEMIIHPETRQVEIEAEQRVAFANEISVLFNDVCELTGEPIDVKLLGNIEISSQEIGSIEPFLILE